MTDEERWEYLEENRPPIFREWPPTRVRFSAEEMEQVQQIVEVLKPRLERWKAWKATRPPTAEVWRFPKPGGARPEVLKQTERLIREARGRDNDEIK
jgi:hypothetical protein